MRTLHVVGYMIPFMLMLLLTRGDADLVDGEPDVGVQAVGARVVSCKGCRLTGLAEVSSFIYDDAPTYDAIEVVFVRAHNPVLQFLDAQGRVADEVALDPFSREEIRRILSTRGITTDTPRPTFVEGTYPPQGNCVAWRQTRGCRTDSNAPREFHQDAPCDEEISGDRSGYCECKDGRREYRACDHSESTCATVCTSATGEL